MKPVPPYTIGDAITFEKSDLRYEILDAQTTSNDDGTMTFHYKVKRVEAPRAVVTEA
jgi:hypothetical protein